MEQVWQSLKNIAIGWGVPSAWFGPIIALVMGALLLTAEVFLVTGIPENTTTPALPTPTDVLSGAPVATPGIAPVTPISGVPSSTPQATPAISVAVTATPVPPLLTPTATPIPPTPGPTPTVTPTPTPTPIPLVGRPVNPGLPTEQEFKEDNMEIVLLFDYAGIECLLQANITEFADDGFAIETKLRSFTDSSCDGTVEVLFADQYNERGPDNAEQFAQWDKEYEEWLTKLGLWEFVEVTELAR
jgi:hypothetical protein